MITIQNSSALSRIEALQKEITQKQEELVELRRSIPPEEVADLELLDWDGKSVKLSSLFGSKRDLIVIHNMGRSCTYCTLWADGFNGVHQHLADRAGFVVVSPDAPAIQMEFARSRGWAFKMLSGHGGTFINEMGFISEKGHYWPGVSTFRRDEEGKIYRVGKDFFGPGDSYCSVWHLLDLLKHGHEDWQPQYSY